MLLSGQVVVSHTNFSKVTWMAEMKHRLCLQIQLLRFDINGCRVQSQNDYLHKVDHLLFIKIDSVMMLATSVSATTGMLSVFT